MTTILCNASIPAAAADPRSPERPEVGGRDVNAVGYKNGVPWNEHVAREEARRFLELLFSGVASEGLYLEVVGMQGREGKLHSHGVHLGDSDWLDQGLEVAEGIARAGDNVYISAAPRDTPAEVKPKGRNEKKDVAFLTALWADIDAPKGAAPEDLLRWKGLWRDFFETEAAALPRPSIRVNSGNGYQLWWLLKEPFLDLTAGSEMVGRITGLIARHGVGDTSVKNADRIMRLPGYPNVKDPESPRVTGMDLCYENLRYSFEQLVKGFPEKKRTATKARAPHQTPGGVQTSAAGTRKLPDPDRKRILEVWGPGNRHAPTLGISGAMMKVGWSLEDAEDEFRRIIAAGGGDETDILTAVRTTFAQEDLSKVAGWEELRRLGFQDDELPSLNRPMARKDEEEDGSNSAATLLVRLAQKDDLFRDEDDNAYATVKVKDHLETWPIKSRGYRKLLAHRFYLEEDRVASDTALREASTVIAGIATYGSKQMPVGTRVSDVKDGLVIDLVDDGWRTLHVGAEGWRVIEGEPPAKLRRSGGMRPLPVPVTGGTLGELRGLLNLEGDNGDEEDDWRLTVGWLLGALSPRGPFPVLVLQGEQGTAKTTRAKMLRALIDPNKSLARVQPKNAQDLVIAAKNGLVLNFDNLSGLEPWLSDLICMVATEGGFSTRELYTDDEEIIINVQRPVILNGISDLAVRGDLQSRSIIVNLPVIPEEKRRPERDLWRAFEEARPRILGALLAAVSCAVRRLPTMEHPKKLPRLADFALWVEAAAPALGWNPGEFISTYDARQKSAHSAALEGSPIAGAIQKILAGSDFEGTCEALLVKMKEYTSEEVRRSRSWPRSARGLSSALRRIAPSLRAGGLEVEFRTAGRGTEKARVVTITRGGVLPGLDEGEWGRKTGSMGTVGDANANGATTRNHSVGDAGDGGDGLPLIPRSERERGAL